MIGENQPPFRLAPDVSVILQLREQLGYDRNQFAELMHVNYDTVLTWELGTREPRLRLTQIKILEGVLQRLGLRFQDIPSNWGHPKK